MEVIGRGYLIEHSMAALRRIREQERERERFKNYIADGLFAISNNLSLVQKYRDLGGQASDNKPEKTAEEIKDKFRRKFAG